jgi:hypothetical protein
LQLRVCHLHCCWASELRCITVGHWQCVLTPDSLLWAIAPFLWYPSACVYFVRSGYRELAHQNEGHCLDMCPSNCIIRQLVYNMWCYGMHFYIDTTLAASFLLLR